MATRQTFQLYDASTMANLKDWAKAISDALSAAGWTKAQDTSPASMVDWTNMGSNLPNNNLTYSLSNWSFKGTFSSGAQYSTRDIVVDGGTSRTYQCIQNNFATSIGVTVQAQQTFTSGNITSVTMSGSTMTIHGTFAGGGSSAFLNYVFTLAGFDNSGNNGVFVCTSSTATTLVFTNSGGVNETPSGTPSATSLANAVQTTTIPGSSSNALAGRTINYANFTNSNNNGNFTVLFSDVSHLWISNASGVTEGAVGAHVAIDTTGPVGNLVQFTHYFYEIWQSTDALTSTSPLFIRINYSTNGSSQPRLNIVIGTRLSGTSGNPTGFLQGNCSNSTSEFVLAPQAVARGSSQTFECDFQWSLSGGDFRMIMWRDIAATSTPFLLSVERSRDNNGGLIDTYWHYAVITGGTTSYQTLAAPGQGTVCPASPDSVLPTIALSQSSYLTNNVVPGFPIFPIFGFVGSPAMGLLVMANGDMVDGEILTQTIYGSAHSYLMCAFINPQSVFFNTLRGGILWE
jgi:hypothetical protein